MSHINLLPWREKQRVAHQQQFIRSMRIVLGFSVFILLLVHLLLSEINNRLMDRYQVYQQHLNQLAPQANILENIQKSLVNLDNDNRYFQAQIKEQTSMLQFLNLWMAMIPRGILLTEIVKHENQITVSGQCASESLITQLLNHIKKTQLFTSVKLNERTERGFTLSMQCHFSLEREVAAESGG